MFREHLHQVHGSRLHRNFFTPSLKITVAFLYEWFVKGT